MVPVRKTVEIAEGVRVNLLVTPHMSVYKEGAGLGPLPADADAQAVVYRYADLMYLAALNAWELDGHGTAEDFPHSRGDFHGFMQADRKGFADAMTFMVSAITGKTLKELEAADKAAKKPDVAANGDEAGVGTEEKKKGLICRIMRR